MPKKLIMDLSTTFAGIKTEATQEIAELQATIEQLRQQLNAQDQEPLQAKQDELRDLLRQDGGEFLVDIALIEANPEQARQTKSRAEVEARAASLENNGQLDPVTIFSHPAKEGKFMLEDGETRWRAAKLLVKQGKDNWQKIRAVVAPIPKSAIDLHKRSLLHSLHSNQLNPLDRIEGIIKQILASVEISPSTKRIQKFGDVELAKIDEVAAIIRSLEYKFRPKKDQLEILRHERLEQQIAGVETIEQEVEPTPEEKQVLLILLELQQHVASVAASDLRMLGLLQDLKEAVREKGLGCNHALAIQKLSVLSLSEEKGVELRQKVVDQVIAEKLSLDATKKLIERELEERLSKPGKQAFSKQIRQLQKNLEQVLSGVEKHETIESVDLKNLESLKQSLQSQLQRINSILERN